MAIIKPKAFHYWQIFRKFCKNFFNSPQCIRRCRWQKFDAARKEIKNSAIIQILPKVGIRNLSPQLRNIADNQIDCGVAD
jgi:hypothetical protein